MFIQDNRINVATRIKELLIDWLVICAYLVLLFLGTILYYQLILKGIPTFSQMQSQLVATVSSVIPIILIFSYLDGHGGSLGKKKMNLKLKFQNNRYSSSLLRNVIKFLPWQLGHMGTIRGMYTDFDTLSILLVVLSVGLLGLLLYMGLFRKDKRHLGDFLAATQVYE